MTLDITDLSIFSIVDACRRLSAEGQTNRTIFNQLLQKLSPYNVKLTHDNIEGEIHRIILIVDRYTTNTYSVVNPYSNVIIGCDDWSIKCVSPNTVSLGLTSAVRGQSLDNYDVFLIRDGTTVTLYHWKDDIFSLATTNGFDVTPIVWLSSSTYGEIFFETLKLYPEALQSTGLRLESRDNKMVLVSDKLRTDVCHSFTLTNYKLHPFQKNAEGLVHIQSLKITNDQIYEAKEDGDIFLDVPVQSPLTTEELSQFSPNMIVEDLYKFSTEHDLQFFVEHPLYGFLLRSRSSGTDILLESKLLRRIRQLVYQQLPKNLLPRIHPDHRLTFIALRAFLHHPPQTRFSSRKDFLLIFPEWKEKFNSFNQYMDELSADILAVLHRRSENPFAVSVVNEIIYPRCNPILLTNVKAVKDALLRPEYTYTIFFGYMGLQQIS
jgi:hypothetical protein